MSATREYNQCIISLKLRSEKISNMACLVVGALATGQRVPVSNLTQA